MTRATEIDHGPPVLLSSLVAGLLALQAEGDIDLSPASGAASCPSGMKLVTGTHDEYLQRLCTNYHGGNCYSFFPGLVAREPRSTPVHVCMDTYEWPNRAGELPVVMARFTEAEALCEGVGKRLCTEFEWELACEGPDANPWPYGWVRDPAACNNGKPYMGVSEAKLASKNDGVRANETARVFQAERSGSFPKCVGPSGVVDLVGNVEEWVKTSRREWTYPSSLKGGYWSKPMSGCRGTNDSHGPMFRFYETGLRCCKDPT